MIPTRTVEAGCEFLCVDDFLATMIHAQALRCALDFHLIDYLLDRPNATLSDVEACMGVDRTGLHVLLELLEANQVVTREGSNIRLTPAFRAALQYRDLLEAKLDFANLVAADISGHFSNFIRDPARFQRESRLFELFDYGHCLASTPENRERTRRWLRLTTCLTRYEAQACMGRHDFAPYRNMLDIGGNSGEFVLRLCKRYRDLTGAVFDLPVVCELGLQHVKAEPEANRVTFVAGNALCDRIPRGFDLITFKSMLHDWPDAEARQLLTRASHALNPGGTLLIFERAPLRLNRASIPYSLFPVLLFCRSYRSADMYLEHLQSLGFHDMRHETMTLDVPFFLITARLLS